MARSPVCLHQEPATIVINKAAFDGLDIPQSRQELILGLCDHPKRFQGRVGIYDLRISGLGYLFATQDAHLRNLLAAGRGDGRAWHPSLLLLARDD